jgi:hypothetical protein
VEEAVFEDGFVGEPEAGDIGGAEAENVFEGTADFGEAEIDAELIEEIEERLGTFGEERAEGDADAVKAMVGEDVDSVGAMAVADDVEKTTGYRKR